MSELSTLDKMTSNIGAEIWKMHFASLGAQVEANAWSEWSANLRIEY